MDVRARTEWGRRRGRLVEEARRRAGSIRTGALGSVDRSTRNLAHGPMQRANPLRRRPWSTTMPGRPQVAQTPWHVWRTKASATSGSGSWARKNLDIIDALADEIDFLKFITVRGTKRGSGVDGRHAPRARRATLALCLATLGPGAHQPDARDRERAARLAPARWRITAQAGLGRHLQGVAPVRRPRVAVPAASPSGATWSRLPAAAPEMIRKAFKQATTERPGATFVILPEDVAELPDRGASRCR